MLHDYFVGDQDKCRIEDLRILLPITPNNIDAVKQLSTCFKIRHAPMMSSFAVVISDCKEAMYTGVTKDLDELEQSNSPHRCGRTTADLLKSRVPCFSHSGTEG